MIRIRVFYYIMLCCISFNFGCSAFEGRQFVNNLLPTPQLIEFGNRIIAFDGVDIDIPVWNERLKDFLEKRNIQVREDASFKIKGNIVNEIKGAPLGNEEAYSLAITPDGINMESISPKGIYWAIVTLDQLLQTSDNGEKYFPECIIYDWPAFPYRGFMMDVGRTYISMEELRREIEIMSYFKMNIFHLHFTENQAWRIESKLYPQLTDSINMERCPGKYYTIEECKELEKLTVEHNMTLIPEIDMPGHSKAFERAFNYDMQSAEGMEILKQIIDETCETFAKSPYMHIGTDEVSFTNTEFIGEMVDFIRERGKKVISWNPGWEYLAGEIDMTQLWSYRGKSQPGIPAIDSRFHYINHFDTYADIRALYRSRIYDKPYCDEEVCGVTLALWNDRLIDNEKEIISQNNLYPLLLATAERAWAGGGSEYFNHLGTNMDMPGSEDYDAFQDFERRLLHYKDNLLVDTYMPYAKQTHVKWLISDPFPNDGNLESVFPPEYE